MILLAITFWALFIYSVISRELSFNNRLFEGIIAFVFSIAFTSFAFFLSLFFNIHYLVFQVAFTIIPFALLIWQHFYLGLKNEILADKIEYQHPVLLMLGMICFIAFTFLFFKASDRWGYWDAWAIWSLHAKFLIYNQEFTNLFTNEIDFTHPDYPLMLPSLIAVFWKSFYTQSPVIPLLIAYTTGVAILILLYSSFIQKKSPVAGIIVLFFLSCTNLLYPIASYQYADTLLALFILVPFILLSQINENKNNQLLFFLVGFFAASCGWIKNEGLAFYFIFSLVLFFYQGHSKNQRIAYLYGSIIPLAVIFLFKVFLAPSNDIVDGQQATIFVKLVDTSRYAIIANYFFNMISGNKILVILILGNLVIYISYYNHCSYFILVVLILMLFSYFFIYVVTPRDLTWHLSTSFDRLLHQLIPTFLFSLFDNIRRTPLPDILNRRFSFI